MKTYTLICFFLSLAMILCPLFSMEKATDAISKGLFGETEATSEAEIEQPEAISTVKVMNVSSKNITEMDLKDYLLGVIAAEVNPAYHEEAIKAQIIASHTLLLYVKENRTDDLDGADITDSSATHQGFLTADKQKEKWGDNYDDYRKKIEKCIDEVIDLTLQYNGEYISAAFHAISNGKTENATDVWGGNYPYLKSVNSIGDKLSPAYQSTVTVSASEFKEKLKDIEFTDEPTEWIGKITNTDTGMVKTVTICEKEFKGTEIRKLFNLKSSTFTCEYNDDEFIFTVCGYGHGVGMSQYGADHMARQGFSYKEILEHYYTDIEIRQIS